MQGVTTAIVAFILAGVIWPHVIKHKVQFYSALITVVFIILLDSVGYLFFTPPPGGGPPRVIYGLNGLLQIAALVLCILSSGLTFRELGGEVFQTIDVVRRGGEKETIIVPLRGEQPKPRDRNRDAAALAAAAAAERDADRDIAAEEAALDAQERAAAAEAASAASVASTPAAAGMPAPSPKPDADRTIPLEP